MTHHISCGGILLNQNATKVCLIYKKDRDEWLIPKGHWEEGESYVQTAVREVEEETGVRNVSVIDPERYQTIDYTFEDSEGGENLKTVYFYLLQAEGDELTRTQEQQDEGLSAEWVEIDRVVEILTHEDEKDVFRNLVVYII